MAQNKEDKIVKSMNSPKEIDLSVKIKIPRSPESISKESNFKYRCTCCGKGFNVLKNNFQKTPSVLFQANDGYLPWCKDCTDKYFILLTAFYSGNEEHAIEHFCQQADWVYDIEPLKAATETTGRTRLNSYASKKNLNVGGRKSYLDTVIDNFINKKEEIIESREQVKAEEINVTISAVDRWGLGFSEIDYKMLDEHYRMLKKNNPNCDNNQEIFVKSLCNLNMLMVRALRDGDSDKYVKLTEQYSKTFTKAGLKTVVESDKNADDCWGLFMEQISQYTPEEYYKDKKLYEDFDGIGKLFERFVLRPLKNILCKTNERDPEYNVEGSFNE